MQDLLQRSAHRLVLETFCCQGVPRNLQGLSSLPLSATVARIKAKTRTWKEPLRCASTSWRPPLPHIKTHSVPHMPLQQCCVENSLDSGRSVARSCRRPCRARIRGSFQNRNLQERSRPITTRLPHLKQTRLNCLDVGSQTAKGPCRQLCLSSLRAKIQ